ncbi:MAG: 5-(carboxyamino)imidazole ribonucleotide synthase [Pirellulaceae bacterium]
MPQLIPPGSTLGVLGSGQLGRMFAIAARRLGYRVHVLSPDDDTPTGQVADLEIRASYDDLDAIAAFARGVSVVTFEFENVPAATTAAAEKFAPVRPGGNVLHVSQNRLREKTFLKDAGIPVTPFFPVRSAGELADGVLHFGVPAVLKTADWGYDGKGQVRMESLEEAAKVWREFVGKECILEQFVGFAAELSVVGVRGLDGSFVSYGPIRNSHANHILDVSVMPAGVSEKVAQRAVEITREIFRRLEVVGVLCVEFFLDKNHELLVNELAPRPHNSGHLTIDACTTCQFEQQVRSVCGLPLGSPRQHRPAAMANLLGDLWNGNPPNWERALSMADVKLHLYGKAEPRPSRKMGHLTALADTPQEAAERVIAARAALTSS